MMRLTNWLRAAHRGLRGRRSGGRILLMYHRVTEPDADPWGLCVSPSNFDAHLQVIRAHAALLPLREITEQASSGGASGYAVGITFDDGYVDIARTVRPLLERHEAPATVFVATGNIGDAREFWWDELERILLRPGQLPAVLELCVGAQMGRWELGEAARYGAEDHRLNRALPASDARPGTRHALYYSLWKLLFTLSSAEREVMLARLAAWAGAERTPRTQNRTLDEDEISALAASGLVEIGAHTVTHPALPLHSRADQQCEVIESRNRLSEIVGGTVESFAYPHGEHSRETVALVRNAGFIRACTVEAEPLRRRNDPLRLPRFDVKNWSGDVFEERLLGWLGARAG